MRIVAVVALCSAAALCQTVPPTAGDSPARIEGRATDTDRIPLAGAAVSLVSATEGRVVAGARSAFDGRYVLEKVPPGTYILSVSKEGYAGGFYSGAQAVRDPAQLVIEPAAAVKGIDVQLERAGAIAGTVTAEDGEPVPNVIVQAYRLFLEAPQRSATLAGMVMADSGGRYRIQGLLPDRYFIAAVPRAAGPGAKPKTQGKAEPHEVATYYPNAADLRSAAPVVVRPSDQANGIDVRMRRVTSVTVEGQVKPAGPGLHVRLWAAGEAIWSSPERDAAVDPATGEFAFPAIPPGRYRVHAFNAEQSEYAHAEIDVSESERPGLTLNLQASPTIQGRVAVIESGRKLPLGGIDVFLRPIDVVSPRRQLFGSSDGSGAFKIAQVPPGRYNVYVPRVPEKSYVKDVRLGNDSAGADFELAFRDNEQRTLLVGISANAGSLAGVVTNASGAPVPGAIAITISDVPGGPAFREVTDKDGEFLERNLPAGRFTVYAFERFDVRLLATPRALSKFDRYAQHVTIVEGERAAAKVRIVPADDVR